MHSYQVAESADQMNITSCRVSHTCTISTERNNLRAVLCDKPAWHWTLVRLLKHFFVSDQHRYPVPSCESGAVYIVLTNGVFRISP